MIRCKVYVKDPTGRLVTISDEYGSPIRTVMVVHCESEAVARCVGTGLSYCKDHKKKLGGHGAPPHTFKSIPKRERV